MDVEKTIEFLLSKQGDHDARIAKNDAHIARLATIAEMQIEAHDQLAKETAEGFRETKEMIRKTNETILATNEEVKALNEDIKLLFRIVSKNDGAKQ